MTDGFSLLRTLKFVYKAQRGRTLWTQQEPPTQWHISFFEVCWAIIGRVGIVIYRFDYFTLTLTGEYKPN